MPITGAVIVPHPPIIFPEIGHGEQMRIQKTIAAYRDAAQRITEYFPDTLVVISPHTTTYQDYFHLSPGTEAGGDFANFGAEQVKIKVSYDTAMVREIERSALQSDVAAGTQGAREKSLDHATMIPIRFIQEAYAEKGKKMPCQVVRVGISGLSYGEHFRLGQCIARAADALKKRVVIVASADLSHRLLDRGPYDFAPEGSVYDKKITEVMNTGNLKKALDFDPELCEKAGECGHRSIVILAGCLDGLTQKSRLLSYEGPFGVGYAVACYQDAYVALARESLKHYLLADDLLKIPMDLPESLKKEKAGAFVSLKKSGALRGCIGTIQAVRENIAEEIIENAVSAGVWDPRFPKVESDELCQIVCTVDVLSKAEKISSKEELDVKRYGVIVTSEKKRGLLLPNLEGVDTVDDQINIALSKAGIEEETYLMERFEVVRHY